MIDSGYAEIVEGWLTADLRLPRKQRHTAMRGVAAVARRARVRGFVSVGAALGQAVAGAASRGVGGIRAARVGAGDRAGWFPARRARRSAGVERVVHFPVVSYPYSNMRYVTALPGETSGCVCHGLGEVFARAGMAPRVVVFDNATGVGHRNADGTVTQTVMFQRFCAQYGFEARFCNPYSGNEKGSVENAVGFVRRNLMVPVPSAEGYQASATRVVRRVRTACAGRPLPARRVRRRPVRIGERAYAPAAIRRVRPGRVAFGEGRPHRDRADRLEPVPRRPEMAFHALQAGVRVFQIELRDPDGGRITTLERVWGRSPDTQADPAALLAVIARKPRSWGESPIRGDFPGPVRDLLDRMDAPERSSLISDIRHAGETYGFPAAAGAVAAIIKAGRTVDRATIETTAARMGLRW